jgi:3-oxochol-4-en-24-oyl-CoA dehydrogenase
MSIAVTEEHAELAEALSRWAAHHVPAAVPRAWLDADVPPGVPFWEALAAQGFLAMHVAEEHGGAGYGHVELAVALEQLGRVIAPGPALPTAIVSTVLQFATPSPLVKELLPALADGSRTAGVALVGPESAGGESASGLRAREGAEGIVLDGGLDVVLTGGAVDVLLLPVTRGAEIVHVIVRSADLDVEVVPSLDPTRPVSRVRAEGVQVAADCIVAGLPPAALDEVAATLVAAEAAGLAGWCLDTAVAYAKTRVQFGKPIGQFQAVKHLCAEMLVRVEQARAVAWDAARALDDPAQRPIAAAVAAGVATEAAVSCAKDCIQVLGGIGFTWEHDAHLYLKRTTALRQLIGGADRWNRTVAEVTLAGTRRELELDLGDEAEPLRREVRAFLAELEGVEESARRRRIADAGYVVPHWPKPWGRDAGPLEQLVIAEEFRAAGVRSPDLIIGGWALPPIIGSGTAEQAQRFVPPTLYGEITWCQMFSEPEAGSDLAALRTKATRTEGGWLLNGQKIWTSLAHAADWAFCLARTNPDAPKHKGITFFCVDMRSEGLDVRPLREITGEAMFNEVFLNDVFVPDDCVIGEVDEGWKLARTSLANERVAMSSGSTMGRGVEGLLGVVAGSPAGADPVARHRLGALICEGQTLSVLGLRSTLRQLGGVDPGASSSVRKLVGMHHAQDAAELALELAGPAALATDDGGLAALGRAFFHARCLTIAGGTTEVQRNVVGERILGLPRDEK